MAFTPEQEKFLADFADLQLVAVNAEKQRVADEESARVVIKQRQDLVDSLQEQKDKEISDALRKFDEEQGVPADKVV